MNSEELQGWLDGLPIPAVRWLESTGSTNDDAAAWVAAGAADGSLVAAERQESGRGRQGRTWVTTPDGALAFSLVLHLTPAEIPLLPLFSPLAGMAVADALETLGLRPELKWPNDVLLRRRKVCGVLAEASWLGDQLQALVIGIGVNIAPSSVPPAEELIYPAACVDEFLDEPVERFDLLRRIAAALFERRRQIGSRAFLSAWESRLAFKGEVISVHPAGEKPLHGTLLGIDAQGNLRMREETGAERTVTAGDVTLRPI